MGSVDKKINTFMSNKRLLMLRQRLSGLSIRRSNLSTWFLFLIIAAIILIESGIIYDISQPTLFFQSQNLQFINIYQGTSGQFSAETIIATIFIALGVVGLFVLKNAPANIDDKQRASAALTIAIIIILTAFALLYLFFVWKINGGNFNNLVP